MEIKKMTETIENQLDENQNAAGMPGGLPVKDAAGKLPAEQGSENGAAESGAGKTERKERTGWILPAALALALFTDLTVYQQRPGLQWALFVNALLLITFILAWIAGKKVPFASLVLAVPIGLAAAGTALRLESFTLLALVLFTLVGLVLFFSSFLTGQWPAYRLREYFVEALMLMLAVFSGLPGLLIEAFRKGTDGEVNAAGGKQKPARNPRAAAVLRGVLIALPLVLILGALLASADTIFSERLKDFFSWIRVDSFNDLVNQAILVGLITFVVFGVLAYALTKSAHKKALDADAPLVKPFLGMTESAIVLLSINLLFGLFLAIQFRYFFAGQAAITSEGYTYAEYARRGFFELLAVAVFSWLVYYTLASVTVRQEKGKKALFSILGALLILQVGVILISAFQRLSLYEAAYGFTQSRLAAHGFMILVGFLLAGTLVLEFVQRFDRVALLLLTGALIFSFSLAALNVDAFVAERNLQRALEGEELDYSFLVWELSEDATGELFRVFDNPQTPPDVKTTLGRVLSCNAAIFESRQADGPHWVSRHASWAAAESLYASHAEALAEYPLQDLEFGKGFNMDGGPLFCIDED